MPTPFTQTMQSLLRDRFRRPVLGMTLVAVLIGIWAAWFFGAEITRFEVSEAARIETDQSIHIVQSPLDGRAISTKLVLGAPVRAGDVLVELDSRVEQLQLEEEQTRLRVVGPQINALKDEVTALERAQVEEQEAAKAGFGEARARTGEAEALSRLADSEAQRLARLADSGLIPQRELAQGNAQAESRRAAAESLGMVVSRLESEQRTHHSDREAELKRLQAENSRLEGLKAVSLSSIRKLEYEIERHRVRAPVDGHLGEVAVLRVGAVVEEGQKLGTVVPDGALNIVAEFPPAAALGRIHQGQPARLRLDGFPWAQYGSLPAEVSGVAGELRDGKIRVELRLNGRSGSPIPLQHGLPGSVEVEVERLHPSTMVLRAAGRFIGSRSAMTGGPPQ